MKKWLEIDVAANGIIKIRHTLDDIKEISIGYASYLCRLFDFAQDYKKVYKSFVEKNVILLYADEHVRTHTNALPQEEDYKFFRAPLSSTPEIQRRYLEAQKNNIESKPDNSSKGKKLDKTDRAKNHARSRAIMDMCQSLWIPLSPTPKTIQIKIKPPDFLNP